MSKKLTYTGGGFGGSLPHIPARDLTAGEVERLGGVAALVKTGLYKLPKKRKAGGKKDEVKHGRD